MLSLHDFWSKFCANAAVLSAILGEFATKPAKFTAKPLRHKDFYPAHLEMVPA